MNISSQYARVLSYQRSNRTHTNMAAGQKLHDSECRLSKDFAINLDDKGVYTDTYPNVTGKLTFDGDKLYWNGNLTELKSFVASCLNLDGKWSSPGGQVKLFKVQNLEIKYNGKVRIRKNCRSQDSQVR